MVRLVILDAIVPIITSLLDAAKHLLRTPIIQLETNGVGSGHVFRLGIIC